MYRGMDIKEFCNHLPIPIIIFDENIELVDTNTEAESLCKNNFSVSYKEECIKNWLKEELIFFKNDYKEKLFLFEKKLKKQDTLLYYKVQLKKIFDDHCKLKNIIVVLQDITSSKRIEKRLKESKKQLHSILENMPIMMDAIDENDNIIVWNKECELVTGYKEEEILDDPNIWKKLYPDKVYRENVLDPIRKNDCNFRGSEYEIICKDGNRKIISWFNKSKDCPIVGWHSWAFGIDITHRRNTEDRLRKKTKELEKIFEVLPDLYFRINSKFEILDCKSGSASDFDIVAKDCIGQSLDNVVPWSSSIFFKNAVNEVFHTYKLVEKEFTVKDINELKYYESRLIPLAKEEAIIFIRDISKRRFAEEALKESELRYRTFFNICPDYIYVVDINRLSILNANPSFLRKFGMNEEDIEKLTIQDFLDDRNFQICMEAILKLKKGQEIKDLHFMSRDDKGEEFYVETNGTPIMKNGRITKVLCCSRDITERIKMMEMRKIAQENQKRLNEAKEYQRLRTEFFANISHEFRTPINVLLGAIQLMDIYLKSNSNIRDYEKLINLKKSMKQNCYRLIRLVNNLMDITRIDSGFLQLNLENCDIVKIINNITTSVLDFTKLKGLTLEFHSDAKKKMTACDPDKIERILLNLLSNAIKFTKQGDKISIHMKSTEDTILISVKDSGIGIKKEDLAIIFERFRQVNKSLTRNNEGSGIGLALVRSLVQMHHGSIVVKSEYGKGSEFIIKFPVQVVNHKKDEVLKSMDSNKVEKVSIEFSDIYL